MLAATENETLSGLDSFLEGELNKELLRFTTAGSVDDGKSTLIGRLLHDCKAVYEDQLASVKKSPINRSGRAIDFSLLTDGLRAEREQGITIDVAYRYFSTARRKFIIADTPGHEQYTRNMATGASTAGLAIILVDATKGLLPQTRRHTYIASLLGISQVVAAVNKMDLIGYSEEVFAKLREDFSALAESLGIRFVECVPVSALEGDNIVTRSERTPWYVGPTLLEHLETVPISPAVEMNAVRFSVQSVIRPDASFRGFAGRVASGTIRPGQPLMALPSGQQTSVQSIASFDGDLASAGTGQSVVLRLADEIDLSRGDMLVSPAERPQVSSRFVATVVWLHATPLEPKRVYLAKHGGRYVKAKAARIRFRVNINTLEKNSAARLEMNEIASVEFETSQPLFFDPYTMNRTTGSAILIDPLTNATVGAVMIQEVLPPETQKATKIVERREAEQGGKVTLDERVRYNGRRPAIFALAGDRGQAEQLERALLQHGFAVALIDYREIPAAARRILFTTLWNLGLVAVSWHSSAIRNREKHFFSRIAGKSYFDLSDAASDLTHGLRIAETLRLATDTNTNEEE
ncbi:MAG TPA: sulfate adenylyltransferase subunit CysN [Candidatus Acidoferrum sp.]|nr:sulfate adenylyltransferase subunit CysN [Candidatus Acidoferrum sp.]